MDNKTHTPQPITVMRDGELDMDYMPKPPTILEATLSHVEGSIKAFSSYLVLQARMAIFDAWNGTNYRKIRNDLMKQKKRERFESSIGLVAIRH